MPILSAVWNGVKPFLPTAASIGGQILSNQYNISQVHDANKANMQFQWQMYERQRADAWNDWVKMNAYNSPEQQMRRYKEAGLNPNLIYSQGDAGNASPIRSSSGGNANIQPATIPNNMIGDTINQYFNVQRQNKQLELLDAQIDNIDAKTITEIERPGLVYEQARQKGVDSTQKIAMFDITYDAKKSLINATNQRAYLDKAKTLTEDQLRQVRLQENIEKVLKLQASTTKDYAEVKKIHSMINKLNNDASENMITGNINFGALGKLGFESKTKGTSYDRYRQDEEVNKYMQQIDKYWYKKTEQQKKELIEKLSNTIY